MWFARLFGGRAEETVDDEAPASAPVPVHAPAAKPEIAPRRPANAHPGTSPGRPKERRSDSRNKGFDPYNSGTFERRNAWERVGRR